MSNPTICAFGDSAILIYWSKEIRPEINEMVRRADQLIQKVFKNQIIETVVAYQSLTIYLKLGVDNEQLLNALHDLDLTQLNGQKSVSYLWEIPVCYSTEFGIDLDELSTELGLSQEKLISLHNSVIYTVYFIGFLPGFLYLGELSPELHFPRKSTPRLAVPAGAVGIGGEQTGIYPMESPGGWHIIGQTPVKLFSIRNTPPISIQAGDKIQFKAVDLSVYEQVAAEVAAGQYSLTKSRLT